MKIAQKLLIIWIVPVAFLSISSVLSLSQFNLGKETAVSYINDYSKKHQLILKIISNIGFGQGIHNFKNYILRGEEKYSFKAKENFAKAISIIDEYLKLSNISHKEKTNLINLKNTITQYNSKLDIAATLVSKGKKIQTIDKSVKIDDLPAIMAIYELESILLYKRLESHNMLKNVQQRSLKITLIFFLISIVITIIICLHFVKDIVKNIKELITISTSLRKGNYNLEYSIEDKKHEQDEFIILKKQLIELSKHLSTAFDKIKKSNDNLEQFAYVASHDLQAPIRKIASHTDLLEIEYNEGSDKEKISKLINQIKNSSSVMIKMIQSLLSYSRLNKVNLKMERVSLNDTVNLAISNLEVDIQTSKAEIYVEMLPIISGSPDLLLSLFQNLISNAIKFRHKNKKTIINIKGEKLQEKIWRISISDNGIGFEKEDVSTMLKPFGRIHSAQDYPGTGIGLAFCNNVLEIHDSSFSIESTPDKGSTFSFDVRAVWP